MSTTMAAPRSEVAPSVALGEICRSCRYSSVFLGWSSIFVVVSVEAGGVDWTYPDGHNPSIQSTDIQ
jgi:hypothetical protein